MGRKKKLKNCLISNQAERPLKFLELILQILDNLGMLCADDYLRVGSRAACGNQCCRKHGYYDGSVNALHNAPPWPNPIQQQGRVVALSISEG